MATNRYYSKTIVCRMVCVKMYQTFLHYTQKTKFGDFIS